MTAVMFFAGAWGYLQLVRLALPPGQADALPAGGGSLLSNSTALLALALLVATAVLAGVLAVARRFSPLASGLPGLLLLAWTALYLVSVRRAVQFIPLRSHSFGAGWEGLLFSGILGAVGAVMIFPMFIPSRWRGPRRADDAEPLGDPADHLTDLKADDRLPQREEQPPLVGTVVGGPVGSGPVVDGTVVGGPVAGGSPADVGVRLVDTTRITGASRALRNTGTFRIATGAQSRATGSFRVGPQDRSPLRRPYSQATDE
jgi:hypothetical protein